MRWDVTSPPAERPVSWADAKAHLRLRSDDERSLVEGMIDAAAEFACESMSCSLGVQTITAAFGAGDPLALPRGPVVSVESVADASGSPVPFELYRVGHSDRLRLTGPVAAYPLAVVYSAGFEVIPPMIRHAMLCHVGTLYEKRETVITGTIVASVPHQLEAFYKLRRRGPGVY